MATAMTVRVSSELAETIFGATLSVNCQRLTLRVYTHGFCSTVMVHRYFTIRYNHIKLILSVTNAQLINSFCVGYFLQAAVDTNGQSNG